jgi:hypothetical protein
MAESMAFFAASLSALPGALVLLMSGTMREHTRSRVLAQAPRWQARASVVATPRPTVLPVTCAFPPARPSARRPALPRPALTRPDPPRPDPP